MAVLRTADLGAAVDAILARAGGELVCATPLGLGKPVPLLNALYQRVKGNAQLKLEIITALSLEIPRAGSDLERRFLEPYARRAFAGVPELDYMRDLRGAGLPANIRLCEFYFRPGSMLGNPTAQQNYISSNYTHVARDMRARGVNAVLAMVSERDGRYSLCSNPDVTLDAIQAMRADKSHGVVAALVNRQLPFMTGEAEVGADYFDVLLDSPALEHPLFGVPNPATEPADHAVGIHVAALVKDGGTLQTGIGSLGDAVAHWLRQRHAKNPVFTEATRCLALDRYRDLVSREGGLEPFAKGLFAASEMFTWGLMTLIGEGVIRRRAEGDTGALLQAAFFLGPAQFYRALHAMPEDLRSSIQMTSVTRINDLFGEEGIIRRQRRDARFINACLMTTLSGASVSDGLADGRVVSGVGGQYNFVAMAHELEGGRSILVQRASYEAHGRTESNIVFNYGHITIPRHLRDIVVTEYGIADLRGRTDAEVAAALIVIADSRFQDMLAEQAKAAGKLPRDWRVPADAKNNTPEALKARLAPLATLGELPVFPLGTDFDDAEQKLVGALMWLKRNSSSWSQRAALAASLFGASPLPGDEPALARMALAKPSGLREVLLRRLIALALARSRD